MVRIFIKLSEEMIEQPITAQTILECGVPINIISAHINSHGGQILADVPQASFGKVFEAFHRKGVHVIRPELINVDSKKCFNCGACVSLCPVNAISLKDLQVVFDKEKCIGSACATCVDACPARAVELIRQAEPNSNVSPK